MDDFGNEYQTMKWFTYCEQYAYSMATFGFLDNDCMDFCFHYCIDYAATDI